jgi:hypothetical protein
MKTISSFIVVLLGLGFSAFGDDAAAKRKAEAAERKAEAAERKAKAVRDAEVKSLKQEVRVLQSQKLPRPGNTVRSPPRSEPSRTLFALKSDSKDELSPAV